MSFHTNHSKQIRGILQQYNFWKLPLCSTMLILDGKKKKWKNMMLSTEKSKLLENYCCVSKGQIPLHILIRKWSYELKNLSICITKSGPGIKVRCLHKTRVITYCTEQRRWYAKVKDEIQAPMISSLYHMTITIE